MSRKITGNGANDVSHSNGPVIPSMAVIRGACQTDTLRDTHEFDHVKFSFL